MRHCLASELLNCCLDWWHIPAINMIQSSVLEVKRLGYLLCLVGLRPHNELVLLLVNTLSKDLLSSNPVTLHLALTLCCSALSKEHVEQLINPLRQVFLKTSNAASKALAWKCLSKGATEEAVKDLESTLVDASHAPDGQLSLLTVALTSV
jgi:hypothetical protein